MKDSVALQHAAPCPNISPAPQGSNSWHCMMASLLESKYRAPKLSKRHSWDLTVLTWAELKQLFWCKPVENTGSLVRRLWANLLMPNLSLGVIGWTITATWLVWDQSVFLCRLGPHNYSSHLNPATFTPASLSGLTLELFFLSGCESQAQKTTKNHVCVSEEP